LTVSVLREACSRVLALLRLSLAGIVRELNATLQRTEESRIYAWLRSAGVYPPRRCARPALGGTATLVPTDEPPGPWLPP
jgi:hypothetical protein